MVKDLGADGSAARLPTPNVTVADGATYSATAADDVILCTYTDTGTVTVTLPTSLVSSGHEVIIKDAAGGASTYALTIDTEGSETIDGADTHSLVGDYDSVTLLCDGTNWMVI